MKSFIKSIVKTLFPDFSLRYMAYSRLILNQDSYLYLTGWMQSFKAQKPMEFNGNPIPWMNFSVVRFLDERLTKELNLFEFGSGYSTPFYATRVNSVTSVEYDKEWFDIVKSKALDNVSMIFKEKDQDGNYCRTITTTDQQYDVVIVDGRDRVNCVKQSIPNLTPKGVIVLDDSSRQRYQEGIDFAKQQGFKYLNIEGLKATGIGIDRTTILYRDENCFNL